MICATFTAWQIVGIQVKNPPSFEKYLKGFGLHDGEKCTKEDLEREAEIALENVKRISERFKNGSR